MKPKNSDALLDILGHDAKIKRVYKNGDGVITQWYDGSIASLYYKNGEWHFCDNNTSYQAQHAYACGYHN